MALKSFPKDVRTKPLNKRQLLQNVQSRARERLFLHKLSYDLKIAAIEANIALNVYNTEVDDAGYDIIVDSGGCLHLTLPPSCPRS